jgi:hypothetical protein
VEDDLTWIEPHIKIVLMVCIQLERLMKRHTIRFGLCTVLFTCLFLGPARADIGDFFKEIQKSMGVSEGLSETKIIDGLKEALEIGTANAVGLVSKLDGYYKDPQIKIPLPSSVTKVEGILRAVGYGTKVDAFELSMNRAAENAAPEAKALFVEAIKEMTFDDAKEILNGKDNEATLYFEDKTRTKLFQTFEPLVHTSMSKVGVTRHYQDMKAKMDTIPFSDLVNFDLDKYVTDRALDGLFFKIAQEERKIRQDPAARVTDLLKDVFSP